jgi:hypothetical protein
MPGVSSLKTIQQSHMWAMDKTVGKGSNPLAANMKTTGNPAHEDMMEAAAFIKPDFIWSTWCPIWMVILPEFLPATGFRPGRRPPAMVDDIFGVAIRGTGGHRHRLGRRLSEGYQPLPVPERPSTTRSTP